MYVVATKSEDDRIYYDGACWTPLKKAAKRFEDKESAISCAISLDDVKNDWELWRTPCRVIEI